eukprot:6021437-Pyramimonas_sp.AAC.1
MGLAVLLLYSPLPLVVYTTFLVLLLAGERFLERPLVTPWWIMSLAASPVLHNASGCESCALRPGVAAHEKHRDTDMRI